VAVAGPEHASEFLAAAHEVTKQRIIPAGGGLDYDWAKDHVFVKTAVGLTEGRVTVVEDTLKPGFDLARHYHRKMTEIFYILEGAVTFEFDDEPGPVISTPGMVINIPPKVWHRVTSQNGGKLITIFTPGGFDNYLADMSKLTAEQFADADFMTNLAEKYDQWLR
jgi:quercetin dioxygenase-like cupin family protein